jgi:hypothetical protein
MRTLAAVSLTLIIGIWSLATLLVEAIGAPVRALAERVEAAPPRKWAFFAGIRRMDTASGVMVLCPREAIRGAVSIELAALDAASSEGKLREWEMELAAADGLLRHGLRCFPYDGNMWLRLAMVQFSRIGPTSDVDDMLRLSADVAPNEAWIIGPRIVFAAKLSAFRLPNVRNVLERDIRTFAHYGQVAEAGALYAQVGEEARQAFDESLALVGDERRAALKAAIAANVKSQAPEGAR